MSFNAAENGKHQYVFLVYCLNVFELVYVYYLFSFIRTRNVPFMKLWVQGWENEVGLHVKKSIKMWDKDVYSPLVVS